MPSTLIRNARIHTPCDPGRPLSGQAQGEIHVFEKGALFVKNGLVAAVGNEDQVIRSLSSSQVNMEVNCHGACLIPGFVDPHTHMCFAERREQEFCLRIAGTPYLDILAKGGGILSSVRAVRNSTQDQLYAVTRHNVISALHLGTTTVEIKSGYGLDTQSELKMLQVVDRVRRDTPVDVVATFLGAHAVPDEYKNDPDAFVDLVIHEMLPAIQKQGIAQYCDVFCEKGVFTIEQSRRILSAAQKLGLALRIHADEVYDLGAAGLASELKAVSADHLLAASDENLAKMASAQVIATLLPATSYSLRKSHARGRDIIQAEVSVALATDCNPGSSYTESMPFVIGLSIMELGLTPSEALTAATLNAAHAVGMGNKTGSLDIGKQADFLVLDGETPAILAYHAGVSPVAQVYKHGNLICNTIKTIVKDLDHGRGIPGQAKPNHR